MDGSVLLVKAGYSEWYSSVCWLPAALLTAMHARVVAYIELNTLVTLYSAAGRKGKK